MATNLKLEATKAVLSGALACAGAAVCIIEGNHLGAAAFGWVMLGLPAQARALGMRVAFAHTLHLAGEHIVELNQRINELQGEITQLETAAVKHHKSK